MSGEWDDVIASIPWSFDPADVEKRASLFKEFDPNGNGQLSLAEVDHAVRAVLRNDKLFNAKPVIRKAFVAAKDVNPAGNPDYVDKAEFRLLLCYLFKYLEVYVIFMRADTSGDRRLTVEEFTGAGLGAEDLFHSLDTDHGGFVRFEEFIKFATHLVLRTSALENATSLSEPEHRAAIEKEEADAFTAISRKLQQQHVLAACVYHPSTMSAPLAVSVVVPQGCSSKALYDAFESVVMQRLSLTYVVDAEWYNKQCKEMGLSSCGPNQGRHRPSSTATKRTAVTRSVLVAGASAKIWWKMYEHGSAAALHARPLYPAAGGEVDPTARLLATGRGVPYYPWKEELLEEKKSGPQGSASPAKGDSAESPPVLPSPAATPKAKQKQSSGPKAAGSPKTPPAHRLAPMRISRHVSYAPPEHVLSPEQKKAAEDAHAQMLSTLERLSDVQSPAEKLKVLADAKAALERAACLAEGAPAPRKVNQGHLDQMYETDMKRLNAKREAEIAEKKELAEVAQGYRRKKPHDAEDAAKSQPAAPST